ncbi:MAG: hypothetical protein ACT4TC_10445 [Myxococcaceae bacterium]
MAADYRINNLPTFIRQLSTAAGRAINEAAGRDSILTAAESKNLPDWMKDNFANFTAGTAGGRVPSAVFASSYMGWAAEQLINVDNDRDGLIYQSELPAESDLSDEVQNFGVEVASVGSYHEISESEVPPEILQALQGEIDSSGADEVIYESVKNDAGSTTGYRMETREYVDGAYDGIEVNWAESDLQGNIIDSGSNIWD